MSRPRRRSSGVEHSLGKGGVGSSILPGGTVSLQALSLNRAPAIPADIRARAQKHPEFVLHRPAGRAPVRRPNPLPFRRGAGDVRQWRWESSCWDGLAGPGNPHLVPHALVAARIARRADLVEQPPRRKFGKRLEARVDDPLVAIQLVRRRRPRRISSRTGQQVPVQLPRLDPVADRRAIDPEPPRQLRLRDALVEWVSPSLRW